jgi:hypothetical protein
MRKLWLTIGAVLTVALFHVPGTQAAPSAACPDTGGTEYIVDTPADATDLDEGYSNPTCNLIILTSIPSIVGENYDLKAKSVTITGPGVEIINSNPSGEILIVAQNGNVAITEAVVKAVDKVFINCDNPANCTVTILNSEVMSPLSILDPGGEVRLRARGDVKVENSILYGGALLYITSNNGSITWFCPGGGACKDPVSSGVAAILCPNGFPCQVNFQTQTDLKNVCQQGVLCGGGTKEIRITAFIDVDISGSTITALDHLTIEAKTGKILAGKKGNNVTTLTGEEWIFLSFGTQDFTDAIIDATNLIRMVAEGGCPAPPGVCIDLRRANLEADDILVKADNGNGVINVCDNARVVNTGSGFPRFNGDANPPYDPNVLETAAECLPDAPPALID